MEQMILKAAKMAKKSGQPMYLYCTAYRWMIRPTAPAFNRQHIAVSASGEATYHEYNSEAGAWNVKPVAQAA